VSRPVITPPAPAPAGADTGGGDRPLRRDAEINLARILIAGRDVFAEHGYDATMEQIAGRAGVGIGTLYRRFPHKSDLVEAVIEDAGRRTLEIAESVVARCPPAEGIFTFLRRCIAAPSCWRMIASRLPVSDQTPGFALSHIAPVVEVLLDGARRAGTIRPDVAFTDVAVLLISVRAVADLCDPHVPDASARFLEMALDGLRPGGAPLAIAPMSVAQLSIILSGRCPTGLIPPGSPP